MRLRRRARLEVEVEEITDNSGLHTVTRVVSSDVNNEIVTHDGIGSETNDI